MKGHAIPCLSEKLCACKHHGDLQAGPSEFVCIEALNFPLRLKLVFISLIYT